MIPPLSTTPSAPTITRSTFSKTYLLKKKDREIKTLWRNSRCQRMTQVFLLNLNIYPTAASRTTVTGTLSFLRASAICRLNTQSTNKKKDEVNECASPRSRTRTLHGQRSLTRLSQAAIQSHRQRSVSSQLQPFPAPSGRLWSTSESGFSVGETFGNTRESHRIA